MARPTRRTVEQQTLLFGDTARDRALAVVPAAGDLDRFAAIAGRLPASIRLGTSSWSFPGWRGLVYAPQAARAALARLGLAAYSSHPLFRTVGLDRAFYAPIDQTEGRELASLVPDGFRFLVKAHQSITRPWMDASGSTYGNTAALRSDGQRNARFLDAAFVANDLLPPLLQGFGKTLGPIVFQFPPLAFGEQSPDGTAAAWISRLDRFLEALPVGPLYVVEVRNRELAHGQLAERLIAVLRSHSVSWGFAVHPTLPPLDEQIVRLKQSGWSIERQPCLCVRWLLGHGLDYEEAKAAYGPFDRIVAPDDPTLNAVSSAILQAVAAAVPGWIIVNNKAEGSAVRTVERLAAAITVLPV
jgi:uncharacterized protein YecE (DUF72 family)